MTDLDAYLREFDACAITPTRKLIAAYVKGQLGPLPRKSIMPIARAAGIAPRTLQELLSLHRWDEELLRSILQRRLRRLLAGPAVAVLHRTVVLKRGSKTPGVDRQEIGPAGRIANACVIVHLSAAAEGNWALLDGELYLPRSWAENPGRLRAGGIPEGTSYRSPGAIGLGLLDRTGIQPSWLLFEPSDALEPGFLAGLEARGLRYVTEIPGGFGGSVRGGESASVREQAESLPLRHVFRLAPRDAGQETACPTDVFPFAPGAETGLTGRHALVVLRHPWNGGCRFFLANTSGEEGVEVLLKTALAREGIVESATRGLDGIGFGHFEVRGYRSLKRHLRLSETSLLFLSEQRARLSRAPRAAAP